MNPRDAAIDELAKALGIERVAAAGVVDLLVLAAVVEAGHRTAETLVEPLAMLVTKHADGVRGVLQRAHRELTEVSDG
jgi:hypothetical protein